LAAILVSLFSFTEGETSSEAFFDAGCTVIYGTDEYNSFGGNNEDYTNPHTRIWFIPAKHGLYGRAFVGFDNGWGQGGVNTEGLAYDWVAGFQDQWDPDPSLRMVVGNPSERMLESCATVDEAIEFFRTHLEPGFGRARILVVDKTGASAIIGARDGNLHVERSNESRGFGYGRATLETLLADKPEATVESGVDILQACLQKGRYATRYSSVFDLKSGDIFLYRFPGSAEGTRLNLEAELEKGAHYYDIPKIEKQVEGKRRPLVENMRRVHLADFDPIEDTNPEITQKLHRMLEEAGAGRMKSEDYSAKFWEEVEPQADQLKFTIQQFGDIGELVLVEKWREGGRRFYRYRVDCAKAQLLQVFELDGDGRLADTLSEDLRWRE
jgi:hypothetical protein